MITLRNDEATCTIDLEAGARLASLTVLGHQLLVQRGVADDQFGWGSFVMVPSAGRIRRGLLQWDGVDHQLPINFPPHFIHGTAYGAGWRAASVTDTSVDLEFTLGDPWPFAGVVRHHVELQAAALVQRLELEAVDSSMPAGMGWHPWWLRDIGTGAPLQLDMDTEGVSMLLRDDDHMVTTERVPVPDGPWDDCFEGLRSVTLRWPGALAIDVDHTCPYVVVYDQQAHAVCVEPQTAPPDAAAVVGEACRVVPGVPLVAQTAWRWRSLAG